MYQCCKSNPLANWRHERGFILMSNDRCGLFLYDLPWRSISVPFLFSGCIGAHLFLVWYLVCFEASSGYCNLLFTNQFQYHVCSRRDLSSLEITDCAAKGLKINLVCQSDLLLSLYSQATDREVRTVLTWSHRRPKG